MGLGVLEAIGYTGIRAHEQVAVSSPRSKEDVFFPCKGGLPSQFEVQREISGLHRVQGVQGMRDLSGI